MERVFIFDVGNVILRFRPVEFLRDMGCAEEEAAALMRIVFRSDEWPELDRGTISEERATEIFCAREPGYAEAIRRTMSRYYDMFAPVEGTAELLHELERAGRKLYYLSNFHEKASKFVVARNPVFSLFSGGLFSWQVKLLKPAPEIYRALLDRHGLDPRDCVFVDDVMENVEAAQTLGMDGVLFTTPEALAARLRRMGENE